MNISKDRLGRDVVQVRWKDMSKATQMLGKC
jgi:hypothetical protein